MQIIELRLTILAVLTRFLFGELELPNSPTIAGNRFQTREQSIEFGHQ